MINRGFYPSYFKRLPKNTPNREFSFFQRKQLSRQRLSNRKSIASQQHKRSSSLKENSEGEQSIRRNVATFCESASSNSKFQNSNKSQRKSNFVLLSNKKELTQCGKRASIYGIFKAKQKERVRKVVIDCKQNSFYRKYQSKMPLQGHNVIQGLKGERDTTVIGWDFETEDDVYFQ